MPFLVVQLPGPVHRLPGRPDRTLAAIAGPDCRAALALHPASKETR